jgi:hypothetical protein
LKPKKKDLMSKHKNSHLDFPRGTKGLKVGENNIKRIGMKKVHHLGKTGTYYGNEGAYPDYRFLKRLLHKNTGRPWNQVYSELCQQADIRSYQGHSFREAVDMYVEKSCYIDENGKIQTNRGWALNDDFYIHPVTGTLEWEPDHRRWGWYKPPVQAVFEVNGVLYHKHDGVWDRVEMAKYKDKKGLFVSDKFFDVLDPWEHTNINQLKYKYGLDPDGDVQYCVWKQSANSREINKLKKKGVAV